MISNSRAPARSIHNGLYQRLVAALIAICTMLTIPQHAAAESLQTGTADGRRRQGLATHYIQAIVPKTSQAHAGDGSDEMTDGTT